MTSLLYALPLFIVIWFLADHIDDIILFVSRRRWISWLGFLISAATVAHLFSEYFHEVCVDSKLSWSCLNDFYVDEFGHNPALFETGLLIIVFSVAYLGFRKKPSQDAEIVKKLKDILEKRR